MDTEDGGEKKRMRQDVWEETKQAGTYVEAARGDNRKPTAMEIHGAMSKCWQIKANWPDPDTVLQTIGPETREQAATLLMTLGTVLTRLQERPEEPAVFLVYKDWANSLHTSILDHKDVHILAATFCS